MTKIKPTTEERFWAKVAKAGPDDCWLWTACLVNGYGHIGTFRDGRQWKANRAAWTLCFGEIPEGMSVCHRCDVKACVNPAHLFLGTHADNMADKAAKGRAAGNPGHGPKASLTDDQVREIFALHGKMTRRQIGERYGINLSQVAAIFGGHSWKRLNLLNKS